MASGYVSVEADEPTSPSGLEFKTFAPGEASSNNGNTSRGYMTDGQQTRGGFWTVEYYQKYFDVDTQTVIQRCYSTLLPTSTNFINTHLTPFPDLYGPFWTLTTLIFSLFVFSSLASSIVSYLSDEPIQYNFQLLSIAVSLVYAYGIGLPLLLWVALRYLGVTEWGPVEAVAVWGYGQFVWIPVSILCVIPVALVRWILVGIAFGLSGYFLVRNVYPILASAEAKATRALVIVIAVLHAALALTFKILFFSYYVVKEIGVPDPIGGEDEPVTRRFIAALYR